MKKSPYAELKAKYDHALDRFIFFARLLMEAEKRSHNDHGICDYD